MKNFERPITEKGLKMLYYVATLKFSHQKFPQASCWGNIRRKKVQ